MELQLFDNQIGLCAGNRCGECLFAQSKGGLKFRREAKPLQSLSPVLKTKGCLRLPPAEVKLKPQYSVLEFLEGQVPFLLVPSFSWAAARHKISLPTDQWDLTYQMQTKCTKAKQQS